jgi:chemotaxis protein CheD
MIRDGKRITVIQGEYRISSDPQVVLTTILGSCVAACMRDPIAGVGGLNHFLLPGTPELIGRPGAADSERYGVYLMELLINGLLKAGASRNRLECKLFGGARTVDGLSDIGKANGEFAQRFCSKEGIKVIGGNLGGDRGRRIEFCPVSGKARQMLFASTRSIPETRPTIVPQTSDGAVEFF